MDNLCQKSSQGGLNKPEMLLRMTLLNISLDHLVHDEIGIDADFLFNPIVIHKPLAMNDKRSSRRLAVDSGRNPVLTACQNEFEGGLPDRAFVSDLVYSVESEFVHFAL